MRVLFVHCRYRQRGGEDAVVDSEIDLLRGAGHEVALFERHNSEVADMGRIRLAAQTIWSHQTGVAIRSAVERFRPSVAHIHNTFPLISPSVYGALSNLGVPIVQTLHNFRWFCPHAMFLRDGKVCEECIGRTAVPAVIHGCYRDSRVQTAVLATMLAVHRAAGTLERHVSRFIALNAFCRDKFIEGGLPANKIVIKPNFVDMPAPEVRSRSGMLFVGRLSPEKGIEVLARACASLPEVAVRVAGEGDQSMLLAGFGHVRMLGAIGVDQVRQEMLDAQCLVMPSIWYENFPRTLVEAFACGLPVIASRLGAMAELVEDGVTGLLFEPGSADGLAECIRWAIANPARMREMGGNARKVFEARYSAEENYRMLTAIYEDAIRERSDSHAV